MSAILSADDLNDFISPGVACIKPVETLPLQKPAENHNPYEVTTEDKVLALDNAPAQISLTDCLACSGCVTSAEAVLVSLQSHSEVLNTLDTYPSLEPYINTDKQPAYGSIDGKIFVASVSPQVRASIAATYGVSQRRAGWMIDQLLGGPLGLASGGNHGSGFTWVVDTNAMREACLILSADEVSNSLSAFGKNAAAPALPPKKPILSSACPGWICYAEKTHPHVLPHMSQLKSPQALTGTLLKTALSQHLNIRPDQIWHLAVMPCFDKKLEASREELTDAHWRPSPSPPQEPPTLPTRDVDCVITARELIMLADSRGISFPSLPQKPLAASCTPPFPDPSLDAYLFPHRQPHSLRKKRRRGDDQEDSAAGPSGGYLYHVLQSQLALHPNSTVETTRGRNADVVEYAVVDSPPPSDHQTSSASSINQETPTANGIQPQAEQPTVLFRAARYYGSRNISNLVRKLKTPKTRRLLPGSTRNPSSALSANVAGGTMAGYGYVEVMACPGGCTNGGGQIKVEDVGQGTMMSQKEWLGKVDEAYFSMSDHDSSSSDTEPTNNENKKEGREEGMGDEKDEGEEDVSRDLYVNGINVPEVRRMLAYWSESTGIALKDLCLTTYREVKSDVGKGGAEKGGGEQARVVEQLAGRIGGGW